MTVFSYSYLDSEQLAKKTNVEPPTDTNEGHTNTHNSKVSAVAFFRKRTLIHTSATSGQPTQSDCVGRPEMADVCG